MDGGDQGCSASLLSTVCSVLLICGAVFVLQGSSRWPTWSGRGRRSITLLPVSGGGWRLVVVVVVLLLLRLPWLLLSGSQAAAATSGAAAQ